MKLVLLNDADFYLNLLNYKSSIQLRYPYKCITYKMNVDNSVLVYL